MGITGLLPFIREACRPANVRDFKGCTVAIDAYSWLHKGAFSCAEKIIRGEKTDGYVFYCLKLLNMLIDAGVKPIMVFDGCNLESKAVTEKKRRENREKTRQRGKELLCEGKVKEARECFQRCVDVTPEMALEVIQACRNKSVDCIVAPYEADSQLAYLNKIKIAEIVITEDSDLVLFGCDKILFKMDSFGGGLLYEKENLPKAFGRQAEKMSFEKFRYMCILSGCDYLPSLPGIGLAKAFKFFTLTNNPDLQAVLSKVPNYLKMPHLVVSSDYKESFLKANNTFLYQLVFCPRKKALVPLSPYPENVDSTAMEYAGKYFPNDLAYQLAIGNITVKELQKLKRSGEKMPAVNQSLLSNNSVLWGDPEKVRNNCSSSSTNKSFIKFTPSVKSCPQSSAKKRTYNQLDVEMSYTERQTDLFSSYFIEKSPVKKAKLENSPSKEKVLTEEKKAPPQCNDTQPSHAVFMPFRKTLSSDSTNVSNSFTNLRKIVRSRFFASTENESKNTDAPKSTWLDCIDSEYQSTCVKEKDNLPRKSECDSGIITDEDNNELSQISDNECKENIETLQESASKIHTFNDSTEKKLIFPNGKPLLCEFDVDFFNNDNLYSETPNTSLNNSQESADDGFSESQSQTDSLTCNSIDSPCENILTKFRFQASPHTNKKATKTPCRTVGLSKKQLPKNSTNVVDTLFNFKFTRAPKIALT